MENLGHGQQPEIGLEAHHQNQEKLRLSDETFHGTS